MPISSAARDSLRDHWQSIATHAGLVNSTPAEPTGGSPAYARQAITWTDASTGVAQLGGDETFDIPAAFTVVGVRYYSAVTSGSDWGGDSFSSPTGPYGAQGTFTVLSASTTVTVNAV